MWLTSPCPTQSDEHRQLQSLEISDMGDIEANNSNNAHQQQGFPVAFDPGLTLTLENVTSVSSTSAGRTTVPAHFLSPTERYAAFSLVMICDIILVTTNLLVILAFAKSQQLRVTRNYYIVNLAVADLILGLVVIPLYSSTLIMGNWVLGDAVCLIWTIINGTALTSSHASVVLITYDRYLLVRDAICYAASETPRRALHRITASWVLAGLVQTTFTMTDTAFYLSSKQLANAACSPRSNVEIPYIIDVKVYDILVCVTYVFLTVIVPIVLLVIFNKRVYETVRQRLRRISAVSTLIQSSLPSAHELGIYDKAKVASQAVTATTAGSITILANNMHQYLDNITHHNSDNETDQNPNNKTCHYPDNKTHRSPDDKTHQHTDSPQVNRVFHGQCWGLEYNQTDQTVAVQESLEQAPATCIESCHGPSGVIRKFPVLSLPEDSTCERPLTSKERHRKRIISIINEQSETERNVQDRREEFSSPIEQLSLSNWSTKSTLNTNEFPYTSGMPDIPGVIHGLPPENKFSQRPPGDRSKVIYEPSQAVNSSRSHSSQRSLHTVSVYKLTKDRRAAITISCMVVLFAVFKVPYAVILIVVAACPRLCVTTRVYEGFMWLFWAKSLTNPIVYAFISRRFRNYYLNTDKKCSHICSSSCHS